MTTTRLPEKEKKNSTLFSWISEYASTVKSQPSPICDGNSCMLRPPVVNSPPPSLNLIAPLDMPESEAIIENNQLLLNLFPADYLGAMQHAAKMGFLYAFISSTPVELLQSYFKQKKLSAQQIEDANLLIRTLTLLSLSCYLGLSDPAVLLTTIGVPLTSYALKHTGTNAAIVHALPISILLLNQIISGLSDPGKTALTFISALSSSWVGTQAARVGYQLASNGLFKLQEAVTSLLDSSGPEYETDHETFYINN